MSPKINLNLDPMPYLLQLLRNEAATFALAKTTLTKEQYEAFKDESEFQFLQGLKIFMETYPELITGQEEALKAINNRIKDFKRGNHSDSNNDLREESH